MITIVMTILLFNESQIYTQRFLSLLLPHANANNLQWKAAHLVGPPSLLDTFNSLQPISSYNFGTILSVAVALSLKILIKIQQPTHNTIFDFILMPIHCCIRLPNRCVQFLNLFNTKRFVYEQFQFILRRLHTLLFILLL